MCLFLQRIEGRKVGFLDQAAMDLALELIKKVTLLRGNLGSTEGLFRDRWSRTPV